MKKHSLVFGSLLMTMIYAHPVMATITTHDFIESATIGGHFEVESSRLALQKSQNDEVRDFAQEMVDNHTQINNRLKGIVSAENLDDKQPTPALDPKHQKMIDKLNQKDGDDFDKLYIKDQVEAHDEAVDLFSDYAKTSKHVVLKQFAKQTLPVLLQHKENVAQLEQDYSEGDQSW